MATYARGYGDIRTWIARYLKETILWGKAWFSYVGKIPDDRGFYCFPTVPDFAD